MRTQPRVGALAAAMPLGLALLGIACGAPDPQAELEVADLETYWAVERPVGDTQYLAPVVRFRLRNKSAQPHRSIQATATFRRKAEAQAWSSAFLQVSPAGGRPLGAGESRPVVLKPDGEGRYTSTGTPESMFAHKLFKDVHVEVFLRLGSSGWVKFGEALVERRIGARGLEGLGR